MSLSCGIAKLTKEGFIDCDDEVYSLNVIRVLESLYKKYTGKEELPFIHVSFDTFFEYERKPYDLEDGVVLKFWNEQQSAINNIDNFDNTFLEKLSADKILQDIQTDNDFKNNIIYILEGKDDNKLTEDDLIYYKYIYSELVKLFNQGNYYMYIIQ